MLFVPLMDVYHNLPIKTRMVYGWAAGQFENARWFAKVDDDMWADPVGLQNLLTEYTVQESDSPRNRPVTKQDNIVVGFIQNRSNVLRAG